MINLIKPTKLFLRFLDKHDNCIEDLKFNQAHVHHITAVCKIGYCVRRIVSMGNDMK